MAIKGFQKKALVFLVKFFAVYGILQAIIIFAPLQPLLEFIASTEAGFLGTQAIGNVVSFNGHNFEIVPNCTGLMGISVLAAIVFSLRKPELKKKICLFALGAAILFPVNLLRVYLVLLSARAFNPEAVENLHIATWFITSAIIIALWYYMTKKVAKVEEFSDFL